MRDSHTESTARNHGEMDAGAQPAFSFSVSLGWCSRLLVGMQKLDVGAEARVVCYEEGGRSPDSRREDSGKEVKDFSKTQSSLTVASDKWVSDL